MNVNLTQTLFGRKKETIKIIPKETNTLGPAGVGYSKHRPSGARTPGKYSAALLAVDKILVENAVSALEGGDVIYGEVHTGTEIIRFQADDNHVLFENERLHGVDKLIPVILYHLRGASTQNELKEAFESIKKDYLASGTVSTSNALLFCDSFYYAIAKDSPEIDFEEKALALSTIEKGVETGLLQGMPILAGLELPKLTGVTAAKAGPKKKKVAKRVDVVSEAKNGKYLIPYAWNEDAQSKIDKNKVLDAFIGSESFEDILNYTYGSLNEIMLRMNSGIKGSKAIGDDILNLTLFGDPSGGKTTIANALGEALGLPVYTISQSKYSEEDTYWGKTTAVEGGFKNVPTPFVEAFTNGGIAVLEEVNLVDPGVTMGALGNAIWSPFILMKDGVTPVERHPLCVIIGTKNIGTFGSRDVNEAFNNRFVQSYEIEEPTKSQFIQFLSLHDSNITRCTWIYDVYARIRNYLSSPSVNADDILKNISFRSCLGVLKGMKYGQAPKRAVKNAITGKIAEIDKELGHKLYDEVVAAMPDLNE